MVEGPEKQTLFARGSKSIVGAPALVAMHSKLDKSARCQLVHAAGEPVYSALAEPFLNSR